jgi:FlaA1/EpsC-like NDP-sugar epimerase
MHRIDKKKIKIVLDSILISLAFYCAYMIRFEFDIPAGMIESGANAFVILYLTSILLLINFKAYRSFAQYVSVEEFFTITKATTIACVASFLIIRYMTPFIIPRSVCIIYWLITQMFLNGSRIAYRIFKRFIIKNSNQNLKRVLIIGAGDAGEMIVRRMLYDKKIKYNPIGLIDDDPKKMNMTIHNVPVIGTTDMMMELTDKYRIDEIVIAVPSASREQILKIIQKCEVCKIPFKSLPSLKEIAHEAVPENHIRNIKVEDLLDRMPVVTDSAEISELLEGKSVMVTGAAGSIGSELCKQILRSKPARLVLFDKSENEMFRLENELTSMSCSCEFHPLVANILDSAKLEWTMRQFKPDIVFHAAAHKHVPLMEMNPEEAIKNNTIGTVKVATAAVEANVAKFIFISTDKAVSPACVMGVSKRLSELFLLNQPSLNTQFIIVRFGNVLGSNGSVIPLFQKQIESGGPVRITDPEMTRFFMTLSEAVHLILHAAQLGNGGEVFILDMGEPMKIVNLARLLIVSYGYIPGIDIEIKFTGRRPGEKLHEELWYKNENPQYVAKHKLLVSKPYYDGENGLYEIIDMLKDFAVRTDREHLTEKILEMTHGKFPMLNYGENDTLN